MFLSVFSATSVSSKSMNLRTTFENQKMASCSLCLFIRSPLPWMIAVLVCSFLIVVQVLSGFLGFGYYLSILILTSLVLIIISTVFLTFSKQKPLLLLLLLPVEKVVKEEEESSNKSEQCYSSTTLLQMEDHEEKKGHLENETIIVQKMEVQRGISMNKITGLPEIEGGVLSSLQLIENENPSQKMEVEEGGMHEHDNNISCLVISSRSSDSLSESESVEDSSTSEDSETADWFFHQSSVCSDGSISDEETLIEIALPTGHYVSSSSSSSNSNDPKLKKLQKKKKKKMPDFMAAKSIFQQHSNSCSRFEINEENLIEIDISMGSIKCCSRFEIEA